ncbi:hypothetical protein CKY28_05235 [Sphingomonas lenta]|uniref:Amidohydrolase-related domain-containing protein n=2 Tax=Sphingomonas lenta TaxID=1141887 RepID=A0A2A2SHS3_9SPHN|nr:hypothetical protein CKY28_05235 [Sphingomonas lenta]
MLAVSGGRFVDPRGAGRDAARVDLGGRWVVPAYGNAHAHITDPTPAASTRYLKDGVLYVWNPNTVTLSVEAKAFFARPDTYDVKIAQGGITEPGGHPERLYVDYLTRYVYKGRDRAWFVGNAFHYGSTPAEIDAALDRLRGQGADFVKAYLLHSKDWERRRGDASFYGQRGLDPRNMRHLVRAARKRGLWVAAHLDTAADLRVAAAAGVAVAAHVPGYHSRSGEEGEAKVTLTDEDARAVVRAGMKLVPTYALAAGELAAEPGKPAPDSALRRRVFERQRGNMQRLKQAGATLLMGTDTWGPIFEEAEHWVTIGAFTPDEATRIVLGTGALLFPERRIGCFRAGCEADFLVLGGDPTRDVKALRLITDRVKAGRRIPVAP